MNTQPAPPPGRLMSLKEIVERISPGHPKYVRKVLSALESQGRLHRFQPDPKMRPRWYASEITEALKPEVVNHQDTKTPSL